MTGCYTGCVPPPLASSVSVPTTVPVPAPHLIAHAVGQLAYTGADIIQLVLVGIAAVAIGWALIRRTDARQVCLIAGVSIAVLLAGCGSSGPVAAPKSKSVVAPAQTVVVPTPASEQLSQAMVASPPALAVPTTFVCFVGPIRGSMYPAPNFGIIGNWPGLATHVFTTWNFSDGALGTWVDNVILNGSGGAEVSILPWGGTGVTTVTVVGDNHTGCSVSYRLPS